MTNRSCVGFCLVFHFAVPPSRSPSLSIASCLSRNRKLYVFCIHYLYDIIVTAAPLTRVHFSSSLRLLSKCVSVCVFDEYCNRMQIHRVNTTSRMDNRCAPSDNNRNIVGIRGGRENTWGVGDRKIARAHAVEE